MGDIQDVNPFAGDFNEDDEFLRVLLEALQALSLQPGDEEELNEEEQLAGWVMMKMAADKLASKASHNQNLPPLADTIRINLVDRVRDYLTREAVGLEVRMKVLEVCEVLCRMPVAVHAVLGAHIVAKLIPFVASEESDPKKAFLALDCLNSLASHNIVDSALIAAGVPDLCKTMFVHLESNTNPRFILGLKAMQVLCKMFGKQESGHGADILFGNMNVSDSVVEKEMRRLTLLAASENDGKSSRNNNENFTWPSLWVRRFFDLSHSPDVANSVAWNPADMVHDLVLVATADRNKPYLAFLVPTSINVMRQKPHNVQVTDGAVQILSQLVFDESLLYQFQWHMQELETALKLIDRSHQDAEAARNLATLEMRLDDLKPRHANEDFALPMPDHPTYVFVIASTTQGQRVAERLVNRLDQFEYPGVLCKDGRIDPDTVNDSYLGVVFLPQRRYLHDYDLQVFSPSLSKRW